MINDISAGALDDQMFSTVAQCQVPYIIMHMIGTPQTMGQHVFYKNLIKEMIYYFSQKIFQLRELGINDLIIDPGFGFSKTLDQNFELLQKLELFKSLELPVLAGLSRKSMLYNLLDINPEQALNATTSANTIALMKGTNILRVHDVKEAMDAVRIVEKMTNRPSA
jgi:dihydropteroate synthase